MRRQLASVILGAAMVVASASAVDARERPERGSDRPSQAAPGESAPGGGGGLAVGLSVTDRAHGVTTADMANALLSGGMTLVSANYTGSDVAAGIFSGGQSIFGFNSGVVLGSGKVQTVDGDTECAKGIAGPNECDSNTTETGGPPSETLEMFLGVDFTGKTYDSSTLDITFVPQHASVQFTYVFGSDEYREYANTVFNDAFGFFVNGQNCALVPGTSDYVSINTINNGNPVEGEDPTPHNEAYYRDNPPTAPTHNTELDGFTTALTCNATVNPGVNNTLRAVVADVSDAAYDSAVMIQGGSFVSGTQVSLAVPVSNSPDPFNAEVGDTASPQATLTGATAGDATGTMTYGMWRNADCSGTPVTSQPVTVTAGAVPAMTPHVLTRNTLHSWQASYSGDASHNASTSFCHTIHVHPAGFNNFDGDPIDEYGVFRPSTGTWHVQGSSNVAHGTLGDHPVPADYNGDGTVERGVFRRSTSTFHVVGQPNVQLGTKGDIPVVGYYDRDGTADPAVYRPSTQTWHVRGQANVVFGNPGDIPVPGDYDGDGDTDRATWSPATGSWNIEGQPPVTFAPSRTAIPVPGKYVNAASTVPALWEPGTGTWSIDGMEPFVLGISGDVPVPADYDGDDISEPAVFRPATGRFLTQGMPDVVHGTSGDIPLLPPVAAGQLRRMEGDYDYNGVADIALFRPSSGSWHRPGVATTAFGANGDIPVPADWDGNGTTDIGVFRPATGTWHRAGKANVALGQAGDVPVTGRWTGGALDIGVYRPSTGTWIRPGLANVVLGGVTGDIPVVGDWDGNGTSDLGIYRTSTGTWLRPGLPDLKYGAANDIPTVADWDGNGTSDLGLFRPSDGRWYRPGVASIQFGTNGDVPAWGDWNGDGIAERGLFRPSAGTWHRPGHNNITFGTSGDIPALRPNRKPTAL